MQEDKNPTGLLFPEGEGKGGWEVKAQALLHELLLTGGTFEKKAVIKVLEERRAQDAKWGEQNHDGFIWLAVLSEEVGELAQAILHTKFGGKAASQVQAEAIQVAAVALAIVECLMRNEGKFPIPAPDWPYTPEAC